MPEKNYEEGFDEFLAEYNAAEIPSHNTTINCSKFTLKEQLERFAAFSHNEDECNTIVKEAHAL